MLSEICSTRIIPFLSNTTVTSSLRIGIYSDIEDIRVGPLLLSPMMLEAPIPATIEAPTVYTVDSLGRLNTIMTRFIL